MSPGGEFLSSLNEGKAGSTNYYALASSFQTPDAGLQMFVAERLMKLVFQAENDLVVPTAGVYEANGSDYFPITERHVFPGKDGIHHGNFFESVVSQERMLDWLKG